MFQVEILSSTFETFLVNETMGILARRRRGSILIIALLLLGAIQPGLAQDTEQQDQHTETQQEPMQDAEQGQTTKSGFETVPQFGGPNSVGAQLVEDDVVKDPWFRLTTLDKLLQPWFDGKKRLNEKVGFSFGLDYNALYQGVSESLGDDQAAGGIFRVFGSWTLLGRDTGHRGSLTWKVEHRHTLGTDIAPQNLGFTAGYYGITGTMFSDYGWGLTNLFWRQEFTGGRIVLQAGQVDPTDYLDVYGLINPLSAFQNLSFATNPTIAAPNQGLGAVFGLMATDNIYLVGGFSDANGSPTEPGFESFVEDAEYFYHGEIGLVSSFDRRYFDNLHLTAWYQDEREQAGVPQSSGVVVSATKFINDSWMPFLRAGWSDGEAPLLNSMVSAGIGYYMSKRSDLAGFGLSWGEPAVKGLDAQYTAELFYRFQFAQNLAITPDLQLILDPANNPDADQIWLFGLRGRLTL